MKALFSASVSAHLSAFHVPYLEYFKEKGFEVHTAANGPNPCPLSDIHYDIPFSRSPLSARNIECYRTLKKIIERNGYDIIHCHTPVVGVLTRLAARNARKRGTAVIYTAHGFHFYRGAPAVRSFVFRNIEKYLCRYTDRLITINEEDFEAVSRFRFKPGGYCKVPGVGVDGSRFYPQTAESKRASREKNGIGEDAFVLVFAAELSRRKNQKMLIEAAGLLKDRIPGLLLLLPGEGPARAEYGRLIEKYGLEKTVRLLGYRDDMDSLLQSADIAVSSALQEGLPVNVVEALCVSLPVVATRVRGHTDLISDGENGFLVDSAKDMAGRILYLYENPEELSRLKGNARASARDYTAPYATERTFSIYESVIREKARGKTVEQD